MKTPVPEDPGGFRIHPHDVQTAKKTFAHSLGLWVAGMVIAVASGSLSWIASRLEVKSELAEMRADLSKLTQEQTRLVSRIDSVLRPRSDDPEAPPPGRLIAMQEGLRYAFHALVEANAAVVAGEPERKQELKRMVGEKFGTSFENLLKEPGITMPIAYGKLFKDVAPQ